MRAYSFASFMFVFISWLVLPEAQQQLVIKS